MPSGVYKHKKTSKETKEKISKTLTGIKRTKEFKEKCRINQIKRWQNPEYRKKIIINFKKRKNALGKHWKMSENAKKRISKALKGKNSYLWQGGKTDKNKLLRCGYKYRQWRERIFKRDNYTCWVCEVRSGIKEKVYLHSHHIKRFANYSELRFKENNGLTLCKFCHRTYTKFGIE